MVALDRKVVILEWLLDPTAAVSECRKSAQWGHKTRQGSADSSLLKTNRAAWDQHTWEIWPLKIPTDSGAMRISSSEKCQSGLVVLASNVEDD